MNAKSFTDVQASFGAELRQVCEDHAPLVVTRTGQPSVVLLSLEDYEALNAPAVEPAQ